VHSRDLSEASFVKAGHARARDLGGMAADQCLAWRRTGDRKLPFAALLACDPRQISRAESVREAGGKPAVACAYVGNKRR
jgi:hypothetical protein